MKNGDAHEQGRVHSQCYGFKDKNTIQFSHHSRKSNVFQWMAKIPH